jgi:hypothetical protein
MFNLKKDNGFNNKISLVQFNSIVDIDKYMVYYILNHYPRSKYIKEEAYNYTTYFIDLLLLQRKEENPLSIIFKDDYKDQIDNLYNEILLKKKDMLNHIIFMSSICDPFRVMQDYEAYINCKDDYEIEICNHIFNQCKNVSLVLNETSLNKYFNIILKDIKDILLFEEPYQGKSIYIWNYSLNYEDNDMNNSLSLLAISLMQSNSIKLITPIADFKIPNKIDENEGEITDVIKH